MPGIETFASYDILDQAITNQQQVSATQFITSATRYDANQNRVLSISPEAVAGRQANNVLQTIYDERDLVFQVYGTAIYEPKFWENGVTVFVFAESEIRFWQTSQWTMASRQAA